MMKRIVCFALAFALLLCLGACGDSAQPAEKSLDLGAVYETYTATLPEMLLMEGDMRLNLMGVRAEDCVQVITAIASEGLRADEVWLIEAVDEAALERLEALAESRINAKKEEASFYSPDQYEICENAVIITDGLYMAVLVSPDVDSLESTFEEALK